MSTSSRGQDGCTIALAVNVHQFIMLNSTVLVKIIVIGYINLFYTMFSDS